MISRYLALTAVGFGLLQAGCIGEAGDFEAGALEQLDRETLDGPDGTGSTNGLSTRNFHGYKQNILEATSVRLTSSYPQISQDIRDTGILDSPEGRTTFKYAAKCGILRPLSLSQSPGFLFKGGNILNTTAGWMSAGLNVGAAEDLFACMAAHVNPHNYAIPLLLSGRNVNNETVNHSQYIYQEALWTAEIDKLNSTVRIHVWPHPVFVDLCIGDPTNLLLERGCGSNIVDCGLTVHQNTAADCTKNEETGSYTCNGRPAIETWLKENDLLTLHPGCIPPQ